MTERAGARPQAAGALERLPELPPALLLHGQPGSARDWDAVVAAIQGRLQTIAVDRPGWDGRTAPGGLEHSSEAAIATLDQHGIERAVVVGLSFGGAVAAWLAARHSDRVQALVLVSPAANQDSIELIDRVLATPVVGYLASAAILTTASLALSLGPIRSRLETTFALPDEYLRSSARRLRTRTARRAFWVEQRALLRELPVLEHQLSQIRAPTTVVVGTRDTVVPLAAGRRLAGQIQAAELVEIEAGHHVLPAEHPQRLAELILCAAGRSAY